MNIDIAMKPTTVETIFTMIEDIARSRADKVEAKEYRYSDHGTVATISVLRHSTGLRLHVVPYSPAGLLLHAFHAATEHRKITLRVDPSDDGRVYRTLAEGLLNEYAAILSSKLQPSAAV